MPGLHRADPGEEREEVELSGDEQDAMAANCGLCWSRPQQPCWVMRDKKVTKRTRKHPHPERIDRAERRGILGGIGRLLIEQNRKIDG